ncbi:MAG TPA: peptide chain release factor N(5)-glutamine methyltransferase [Pseudomonadales bacterium]|nr:peptide chain release factor N(5)-glutamine methyltransferase [Pseudomonadales bacterium]
MKAHHSIAENLAVAARYLQETCEDARRDAEILLCAVLECERTYLYAHGEKKLGETEADLFRHYLERRHAGEPVAYIIGRREFWSLLLAVNESTLIPRHDTEILVETALALCKRESARVLDLGTGSGAIALALAVENPQWQIDAVDVQEDAVALAQWNARQLGIANVNIYRSDWFSAVPAVTSVQAMCFDMIVSNPPYIDAGDPHLALGDLRYEPHTALVAADRGYADLFTIAREAKKYLCSDGWLLLEHGFQQAGDLRIYLHDAGYHEVQTFADLGGNDRVTIGRKP